MIYWELFVSFLRVGLFSFGGAYGAIPLIREEVLRRGWLSDEALSYMIAVSESTPGPIMVNTATYIGSSQAGFFGALLATTAVILPSFLIILLVMAVLKNAIKNPHVQALLKGLRPCVVGIILVTGIEMVVSNCFRAADWKAPVITAILAGILFGSKYGLKKKLSPITLILIAAFLGIVFYGI